MNHRSTLLAASCLVLVLGACKSASPAASHDAGTAASAGSGGTSAGSGAAAAGSSSAAADSGAAAGAGASGVGGAGQDAGADAGAADPCAPHTVSVATSADLAKIAHCTHLYILSVGSDLKVLELPLLTEVGDSIVIGGNPMLTRVSFPALTIVGADPQKNNFGGFVLGDNPVLSTVEVPKLATIDVNLTLESPNPKLTALDLPALTNAGRISLFATALTKFEPPLLATVGDLDLQDNPDLTSLRAPMLTMAQFARALRNPKLPSCQVQALFAQLKSATADTTMDEGNSASCP